MSDRLLEATYRAERSHFWWRGFRQFIRPVVAQAIQGVEQGRLPRLLDVGCGTGANVQVLSEFGDAYGFDLTFLGLRYARVGYGQRHAVQASAVAAPFPDSSFDVVTAFDVLYALSDEDETAAIREMYRMLRPGGATVVNVAALRILRGAHAEFGGELKRSSRRRLRRVLSEGGFEVEWLTYTNFATFPLALVLRNLQRVTGYTLVEDIALPPASLNAAIAKVLSLEAGALRRLRGMPIGSSLLCLARKPCAGQPSTVRATPTGSC